MLGGKTYPFWSMQQNKQARLFNVGEHPRMQFHVHWVQVLDSNLRSIHERIPAPSLSPPPLTKQSLKPNAGRGSYWRTEPLRNNAGIISSVYTVPGYWGIAAPFL